MPEKKKTDYPVSFIRKCLEHYDYLVAGRWWEDECGESRSITGSHAPYEAAIIAKSDIDTGIGILSNTEKKLIEAKYLFGYVEDELVKMFADRDIKRVEKGALRNMANYLNGECVLYRWCKCNGFVDESNHILIPEDLPPELSQFIKDICTDFCVIEECPENV